MQYALLIYSKPGAAEALSPAEREANHREYLDIKKLPGVVGGASLHPVGYPGGRGLASLPRQIRRKGAGRDYTLDDPQAGAF